MAEVGDSARTAHGLGEITEIDQMRGRKSFRVAGRNFNVWVDETKLHVVGGLESTIIPDAPYHVDEDNSTTLPWNGSPQHPWESAAKEQTILPGEFEIDADDRLHPSDSRTQKNKDSNRPYPGPNPDLFEKSGGLFEDDPARGEWGEDEWHEGLPDGPERTMNQTAGRHSKPPTHMVPMDDVEFGSYATQDPPMNGGDHEGGGTQMRYKQGPGARRSDDYTGFDHRGSYRPAGLSAKYAWIPAEPANPNNPIVAFRRDPVAFIEARGHADSLNTEHLASQFGDYTQLIDVDSNMRTSAWSDVRQKAQRLRREGRVQINDIDHDRIYATVQGDNGTYETMIAKGGSMGGIGGGQSITNWHCGCDWGKWAFQRRFSFVGRLCSHAYAAYLDMQSAHIKKNPSDHFKTKRHAGVVDEFKTWLSDNDKTPEPSAIADFMHMTDDDQDEEKAEALYDYVNANPRQTRERKYDIDYVADPDKAFKEADILHTRPQYLQPRLQEVPRGEDGRFVDVTEDERETTGPDESDIVHFSHVARALHGSDIVDSIQAAPPVEPGVGAAAPGALDQQLTAALHRTADPFDPGSGLGRIDDWLSSWVPGAPQRGQSYADTHGGVYRDAPNDQQPAPAPHQGVPARATQSEPASPSRPAGQTPGAGQPGGNQPGVNESKTLPAGSTSPAVVNAPPAGYGNSPPQGSPTPANNQPPADPAAPKGGFGDNGQWNPNPNKGSIGGSDYTVQSGDTLSGIAERAGLGKDHYQELAQSSGISDPNMITPGQTIKLPGQTQPGAPGAAAENKDQKYTGPAAPAATNLISQPGNDANSAAKSVAPTVTPPPAPTGVQPPPAAQAIQQSNDAKTYRPASRRRRAAEEKARADVGEAAGLLDRLRELSDQSPSDSLGSMDDRNEEVRELTQKLEDAGIGASQFVANTHYAADDDDESAADGNPDYPGTSFPGWADEPFSGSGPDPKYWHSTSESYLDEHAPDYEDVTDAPDGDIIKFNDSRSKPPQGPRHSSYDHTSSLHHADRGPDEGMFNPHNPSAHDWDQGSGDDFVNELSNTADNLGGGQFKGIVGEGGEAGGGEGAVGALAENPELLALASKQGSFSLEAFDRGEFSPEGDLRHAQRAGHGPRQEVRVDAGTRGHQREAQYYQPPEDFGFNGLIREADYQQEDPTGMDIVASFQQQAGNSALANGPKPGSRGANDDVAAYAQRFLRTAGRKFSLEEQRDLEQEEHHLGARNLPNEDDLAGTHYLLGL